MGLLCFKHSCTRSRVSREGDKKHEKKRSHSLQISHPLALSSDEHIDPKLKSSLSIILPRAHLLLTPASSKIIERKIRMSIPIPELIDQPVTRKPTPSQLTLSDESSDSLMQRMPSDAHTHASSPADEIRNAMSISRILTAPHPSPTPSDPISPFPPFTPPQSPCPHSPLSSTLSDYSTASSNSFPPLSLCTCASRSSYQPSYITDDDRAVPRPVRESRARPVPGINTWSWANDAPYAGTYRAGPLRERGRGTETRAMSETFHSLDALKGFLRGPSWSDVKAWTAEAVDGFARDEVRV
ncbi:MAG: hypothetical protein MMC23_003845 [Stictis urceolatum]|nr:hypothetical protein [Stictis urceolata]